MHHSSDPFPIGATGNFPQGKLNESDEGEIAFGVKVQSGKVVLEFGKPVAWLGMDARQAEELADILKEKARQSRGDIRSALASVAKPKNDL